MVPLFGLRCKETTNVTSGRETLMKRGTCPSRKHEYSKYLSSIGRSILDDVETFEAKSQLRVDLITTGTIKYVSQRQGKFHVNDPPLVSSDYKKLIKSRLHALSNGEIEIYCHHRNLVKRERKIILK